VVSNEQKELRGHLSEIMCKELQASEDEMGFKLEECRKCNYCEQSLLVRRRGIEYFVAVKFLTKLK
jgi:hypothetical protein